MVVSFSAKGSIEESAMAAADNEDSTLLHGTDKDRSGWSSFDSGTGKGGGRVERATGIFDSSVSQFGLSMGAFKV